MAEEPESAGRASSPESGDGAGRNRDESQITAPSLGPNTVIEREPVEERLARHEQSEADAMGKDKRRAVVGHSYGPSVARQAAMYGIFLAVLAALVIGGIVLISKEDTGVGKNVPNSAAWAQPGAHPKPPPPIQ